MDIPKKEDIVTREIRDSTGRLIGNVVGRKGTIEHYRERDIVEQMKRDEKRNRDIERR